LKSPKWWSPSWAERTSDDPDSGWEIVDPRDESVDPSWIEGSGTLSDDAILVPLEAQFGQVRSRERVRDLAEVFTHQREVDAILDMMPEAFGELDVTFLEPACGSGNFLTEVVRRKLRLVAKAACVSQEQYEHRLLRALASIYGVDISPENIAEARGRMAHVVLEHYQADANTIEPTTAFLNAAALILGDNIVVGDTLNSPDLVELCEWRPHPGGRFQRIWSHALVSPDERNLFWTERVQDPEPVHYSELVADKAPGNKAQRTKRSQR
jgi:SAM-dependent methyltransferase